MTIRRYKPTSPGTRFRSVQTDLGLTDIKPLKSLTHGKKRISGRNRGGEFPSDGAEEATSAIIGSLIISGTKRESRPPSLPLSTILTAARGSLGCTTWMGKKRYMLAPQGLNPGDQVISGPDADIVPGNNLPIINIPMGTIIHNIELSRGKGGQLARCAGAAAQLMAKEGSYAQVTSCPPEKSERYTCCAKQRWARLETWTMKMFLSGRQELSAGGVEGPRCGALL